MQRIEVTCFGNFIKHHTACTVLQYGRQIQLSNLPKKIISPTGVRQEFARIATVAIFTILPRACATYGIKSTKDAVKSIRCLVCARTAAF